MGSRIELRLPLVPESVPIARRRVERALEPTLDRTTLNDLQLVVSELVSNSVRHAGRRPEDLVLLRGTVESGTLRMEVKDEGPGFEPNLRRLSAEDTGWGLHILNQLVDRWGTTGEAGGVWAEMDIRADQASRAQESIAEDAVDL
jgi:anti-sigma regulatory factor (Ser/Thr protein kinase)